MGVDAIIGSDRHKRAQCNWGQAFPASTGKNVSKKPARDVPTRPPSLLAVKIHQIGLSCREKGLRVPWAEIAFDPSPLSGVPQCANARETLRDEIKHLQGHLFRQQNTCRDALVSPTRQSYRQCRMDGSS